ncbi:protein disks lost [Drosophila kikkawai]|uniref:Protein disks lost n=1 Tax=Drosophila kikkawai TaxID=30033 RepID=A0A6P4IMG8_DROKI|nr:protein disks lost [Drosophila kikkawai]
MPRPEETHLQQLLVQLEKVPRPQLQQKFLAHFRKQSNCSLEDFAAYFLAALRQQTSQYFQVRNSDTPVHSLPGTPVRQPKPPPGDASKELDENLQQQLLNDSLLNRSSCSVESTSTPLRQQGRRSMPGSGNNQFCSTPQTTGHRSNGGGGGGHSFCLGDFLVNSPNQGQQRSKKKTTPQQSQNQHQSTGAASGGTVQSKPRRRVLPMTISKNVSAGSSFGDTSSFSNDNNLWRLSQSSELFDRSQGAALDMEARKTLLLHKQEIKIEAPPLNVSQLEGRTPEDEVFPHDTFSLEDVTDSNQLQLLSVIYSLLIDLNMVPNVLSELSFVLQLINVRDLGQSTVGTSLDCMPLQRVSSDYKSCVYFALKLLENQQRLLLQLDKKTLGVLLQNERLNLLPPGIVQQLEASYQQKQDSAPSVALDTSSSSQHNVYYHVEKDSRDNFPSQNEFAAFKTQRDLFYKALKQWELGHLNRNFNFTSEVAPCIREIFKVSEHPVNMAHFAKLFVSQLLISATENTESPEELGLKLDPLRLNRLAQRLVTSDSSVEGQFPRSQAFFRDFIAGCSSMAFHVQLKLALFVQLLRHNDSTFDLLQLSEDVCAEEEQSAQQGLYIVRVQTMAHMLILAKFLGFVSVLPFSGTTQHGNPSPPYLCPQQLQLRSRFQPDFNLRETFERSMRNGKLLISLPWLVQYLAMLDPVSLNLPDALATLEILYGLYASLGMEKSQPGAVFIARCCIGWLLDAQPQLVNAYYSHRSIKTKSAAVVELCLSGIRCHEKSLGPLLEELLPIACPFLQEFRVSITPSRQAKSGRFRYITTRLEQLQQGSSSSSTSVTQDPTVSSEQTPAEQQQRKLADAFLHSQNASTRRLIEFVTERSFKCVVKDAQQEILLPSKASADAKVNEICSVKQDDVLQQLQHIFQGAKEQACQKWKEQVPQMLGQRIAQSLEALLPASTNAVLRSTYAHLIRGQAQTQLQQWLQSSVLQSTFYHGDLKELAIKVCNSNKNKAEAAAAGGGSNELQLRSDVGFSLSELLFQLQQWLHHLSLRPENVGSRQELGELLRQSQHAVLLPQLPTIFYHLIGSGLVHLLQLFINRKPDFLDEYVISACCTVWRSPQFKASEAYPGIFEGLLSVRFIQELSFKQNGFRLLEQLLRSMLLTGAVRADHLNEIFMPLFAENWPPHVWSTLSNLLQQLSLSGSNGLGGAGLDTSGDSNEDEAKSHLFMEMLADLSRDLDSF